MCIFEENDYAQAATYLRTAATLSPHSAQTLTLLGRANLAQKNYPATSQPSNKQFSSIRKTGRHIIYWPIPIFTGRNTARLVTKLRSPLPRA